MFSNQIRSLFLKYFEGKGHTVLPSSSLVPQKDPTLLLTNAGMVPIKPYYLGLETPPNSRLASCQKCFRTSDIESVGDTSHLTFFEMLGNFSVGDYFKEESIAWAWELLTGVLKIPVDRLWITVYIDDNEAAEIWHKNIGIPRDRILAFGEKDNFWGPAGSSGPCGPCSEIHYDFGEQYGCGKPTCGPGCECGRFIEIWNLVFTQYNQDEDGVRTLLPRPNIDTGMGLERLATILQGKVSVYDTDIFAPLLVKTADIAGKRYGENEDADRALRVIIEHSRAISFLIADGVIPANDGRGYVLRRLIRRTALFGKGMGLELFMKDTCNSAIQHMLKVYPELGQRREFILKLVEAEEARFHETLNIGLNKLDAIIADAKHSRCEEITGDEVFRLYDTYGFPVELTREILTRSGLSVDMEGFERGMKSQRERARASQKFNTTMDMEMTRLRTDLVSTVFEGYHQLVSKSRIVDIIENNRTLDVTGDNPDVGLILENTPFYGEKGGQAGDTGVISNAAGRFAVTNTFYIGGNIIHQGKLETGSFRIGDEVTAEVDARSRGDIARNHTATHLLQYALRKVLGHHVQQRGSMVGADEFRFDFSHLKAMTSQEILDVQRIVNEKIRENLPLNIEQLEYNQAVSEGAIALFGEKYEDKVRVIKIGIPFISAELCGGTHVSATGQLGFFQIVSESSIGAGLRRIEAVTGTGAENYVENINSNLQKIAQALGTAPSAAYDKVIALQHELEEESKKLVTLEREKTRDSAYQLLEKVENIDGISLLVAKVDGLKIDALRQIGDILKEKMESGILVLGSVHADKPSFVAMVTPDLISKGYNAGDIIKKVARVTGGGGGGKAGMAQAGGNDADKIDEALALVRTLIK